MPEMYEKWITVLEPECDLHKRMSLSNIMRHAQQMGSDHIRQRGLDYNKMAEDGMVFVVAKQMVNIRRRPAFGERLLLRTVPKKPKGVQFIRDTTFETEDGEQLIEVSIAWALVDPMNHKILRPAVFERYGFGFYPNDGEYITGYRIKKPEASGTLHLRQIKYSDLDYNRHVNNAIYADIVSDLLPQEDMLILEPIRFGILYHHEATLGQVIEVAVIPRVDGDGYYAGGTVDGGRCFEAEMVFG